MSQDFNLRFDEIRQNDPTVPQRADNKESSYPAHSQTRNLDLVLPDGTCMFLNYAYLVCGTCAKDSLCIILTFTTHVVTIKGLRLKSLYDELLQHLPRTITCADERYNALAEDGEAIVNDMSVEEK